MEGEICGMKGETGWIWVANEIVEEETGFVRGAISIIEEETEGKGGENEEMLEVIERMRRVNEMARG
jgi:hypothetical protein